MYKHRIICTGSLRINESVEGENIIDKVRRIIYSKEPISDGAPIIYQERKDGVRAEYDIRTDRFDVALDAIDVKNKSVIAKREEALKKSSENNNVNIANNEVSVTINNAE